MNPAPERPHRRRRALVIAAGIAGVVAIAGGTVGVVAASASTTPAASAPSVTGSASTPSTPTFDTTGFKKGGNGIFTDRCGETRIAADDPIKMPGMAGQSMVHDFYGNTSPTASSTPASLVGGGTKCSTTADASSYWVPQLYQNGKPLTATSTLLYWRASKDTSTSVKTIPAGFDMIAGNENGTQPAGIGTIGWGCSSPNTGDKVSGALTASPHECSTGHDLREVITFPDCWDGKTLDGRSQQNVVNAASADAACPASHPIRIPQVVLHLNYPTTSDANLTLSTGPTEQGSVTTAHADFMNGWTQSAFDADVAGCVAAQTKCAGVTGPDATPQGSKASPQKKERRAEALHAAHGMNGAARPMRHHKAAASSMPGA